MKLLIIGDLHGQIPNIYFKKFDAIIVPGDLCLDTDIRKYISISYKEFLSNPNTYREWWDIVGRTKAKKYVDKSINAARIILKKLDSYNVPIYVIPGNWDFATKDKSWSYVNKNLYEQKIIKGFRNVVDVHQKIKVLNHDDERLTIIGYGLVNGPELLEYRNYPNITKNQYAKNRIKYSKLLKKYNAIFEKAINNNLKKKVKKNTSLKKNNILFMSHNVPFNTPLDKIVNPQSPMNGNHYGSNLSRELIIRYNPLLCVCGHMHEHYGTCKIKNTIILNAGFGKDKNTLIEIINGKIKKISFHGKRC